MTFCHRTSTRCCLRFLTIIGTACNDLLPPAQPPTTTALMQGRRCEALMIQLFSVCRRLDDVWGIKNTIVMFVMFCIIHCIAITTLFRSSDFNFEYHRVLQLSYNCSLANTPHRASSVS